jgi:hypothetical protein
VDSLRLSCSSFVKNNKDSDSFFLKTFFNKKIIFKNKEVSKDSFLFFSKTILLFSCFKLLKEDVGLFLTHLLANTFRSLISYDVIIKNLGYCSDVNSFHKCGIIDRFIKQDSSFSVFKRTNLKSILAKEFLNTLKLAYSNAESAYLIKNKDSFTTHLTSLLEDTLKDICACTGSYVKKNFSNSSYISSLENLNIRTIINNICIRSLGDLLINVFECSGILELVTEKTSLKTVNFCKIQNDLLKDLFDIGVSVPVLPLIVPPRKWKLVTKSITSSDTTIHSYKDLDFGGFLSNDSAIFPGIKLHSPNSFVNVSNSHLKVINYLQSMSFSIDSVFLDSILNTNMFIKALTSFLSLDITSLNSSFSSASNLSIFSVDLDNKLIIYSIKEFEEKYLNRHNVVSEEILSSKNEKSYSESKVVYLLQQQAAIEYSRQCSLANVFFTIVCIAMLYKDYTIFYPWFFDYRLRVYPSSSYLQPQGCCFSKSLLLLNPLNDLQKTYLSKSLGDKDNSYYKLQKKS